MEACEASQIRISEVTGKSIVKRSHDAEVQPELRTSFPGAGSQSVVLGSAALASAWALVRIVFLEPHHRPAQ